MMQGNIRSAYHAVNRPPDDHGDMEWWVPGFAIGPYAHVMRQFFPAGHQTFVSQYWHLADPPQPAEPAPEPTPRFEKPYSVLSQLDSRGQLTTGWLNYSATNTWIWINGQA